MTRSQWRRFNWLENKIWNVGIVGLSREEFRDYYDLAKLVVKYHERAS